ncbi:hypothetical protein C8R45DRAFT_927692 [Mycena sanguinolenta]|nr:hypothetical protein C8R45DRAFT_927692 [Mycena sanguinolenta]
MTLQTGLQVETALFPAGVELGFLDASLLVHARYCIFMFKSTWGVMRDLFYLFDISVQGLAERDNVENFGNASKAHGETKNDGPLLWADFNRFGTFLNLGTNSTNVCVMRDLDQSSGLTEGCVMRDY